MGKPEARQFAVLRRFGPELVVVDERHDVAHRLDADAAAVWRACDGRSTPAEIAAAAGLPEPRAEEVLAQLAERDLLAGTGTRRAMLRRAVLTGAAVGAAPAIASVLLPTPAQAFASGQSVQGSANSTNPPPSAEPQIEGSQISTPPRAAGPEVAGKGPTRAGRRPSVAGARSDAPAGVAGGGGAPRRVAADELPFTGTNVVRTAAVGAALTAAGVAGHVALKHSDSRPPAP